MSKKDYIKLADMVKRIAVPENYRRLITSELGGLLKEDNPNFSWEKWWCYTNYNKGEYND